jgi:hypothetical protein
VNRPKYEYRCGTCRSTDLVIRPVGPGSRDHPHCFHVMCSNGHQLVGSSVEYELKDVSAPLEFRTNRPSRPRG